MPENKKPTPQKPDPEEEKKRQQQMQRRMSFSVSYLLVGMVVLWLFQEFILTPMLVQATEIPYSEFKQKITDKQIVKVNLRDNDITGEMKNPTPNATPATVPFETVGNAQSDPKLVEQLQAADVSFTFQRPPSPIGSFFVAYLLPLLLLGGFWYLMYRRTAGGAGGGGTRRYFRRRQKQSDRSESRRRRRDVQRCRRERRSDWRIAGDHPIPQNARAICETRRTHPERRVARRSAWDGQDLARESDGGRSARFVFRDERIGVRRNVRRRRRGACARSVRASAQSRARDRLH